MSDAPSTGPVDAAELARQARWLRGLRVLAVIYLGGMIAAEGIGSWQTLLALVFLAHAFGPWGKAQVKILPPERVIWYRALSAFLVLGFVVAIMIAAFNAAN